MRVFYILLLFTAAMIASAWADLTLVQNVQGTGSPSEVTIKIKGDKVRIDASPNVTTIFNSGSGELINLMKEEKRVVRIPADKLKAAAEMISKFSSRKKVAEKPKLTATGRKETINGYETQEYVYDGPDFKAVYWIATDYPNGAEILKQLQAIKTDAWNVTGMNWPDYHDFPGLPLRTHFTSKNAAAAGADITSTIVSVNQDPVSDSEFTVPSDFKEVKVPDIFGGKESEPPVSPTP